MDSLTNGNNCGHLVANPRFFAPPKAHAIGLLRIAQDRAKAFYSAPLDYLKRLHPVTGYQKRSERREAIASALRVLFQYTDLKTLAVGSPMSEGFYGIQLGFIKQKTGFNIKRIWRALKDLQLANYINIHWQRLKKCGRFMTIRQLTIFPSLFHDLGISHARLTTSRHYKDKSLNKKAFSPSNDNYTKQERVNNINRFKDILRGTVAGFKPSYRQPTNQSIASNPPTIPVIKATPKKEKSIKTVHLKTHEERVQYNQRRLDHYMHLQTTGLTQEAAKAATDELYPPVAV